MKSALKLVAFAHASDAEAAIALLETALETLDRTGQHLSAALVDLALTKLYERNNPSPGPHRLNS